MTPPQVAEQTSAVRFSEHLEVTRDMEGWFSDESAAAWDALLTFQSERSGRGHLLEIGVWHGKSAALMAVHAERSQEVCVLVDKFMNEGIVTQNLLKVRSSMDASIRLLAMDSRRLAIDPLLSDGFESFRWIHIDGEHTAGAVTNDLKIANALLAPQGIVCIDDFFNFLYPQITEAVFRYLREHPDQFSLFLCGYNKAYLARPHFVHEYLAFCKNDLTEAFESRGVEATLAKSTLPAELNAFGMGPRFNNQKLRGPDWAQNTIRI